MSSCLSVGLMLSLADADEYRAGATFEEWSCQRRESPPTTDYQPQAAAVPMGERLDIYTTHPLNCEGTSLIRAHCPCHSCGLLRLRLHWIYEDRLGADSMLVRMMEERP